MNKNHLPPLMIIVCLFAATGCAGSKYGSANKNEKVTMAPCLKTDVINYAMIKEQDKPTTLASRGKSRGVMDAYAGGLVSLGVTAVKNMIAGDQKKYTGTWTQGLNDLYFYDQPSSQGPFDPVGMQFDGFTVKRVFRDKNGKDGIVAVIAEFALDTTNYNEIINNAVFKLRVKSMHVCFAKAKVPLGTNYINLDFQITFSTSYIGENGTLNKDVELGKFVYSLRHAPLDSTADNYKTYYAKLKDSLVTGKSFIVPRSYGYYKQANGSVVPYYNQGQFSIAVNVTESSKDSFINQMLINSSGIGLDYTQSVIMGKLQPPAAKSSSH
jgi:hypothetical protein